MEKQRKSDATIKHCRRMTASLEGAIVGAPALCCNSSGWRMWNAKKEKTGALDYLMSPSRVERIDGDIRPDGWGRDVIHGEGPPGNRDPMATVTRLTPAAWRLVKQVK